MRYDYTNIPIEQKLMLTVKEAAKYSNMRIDQIESLMNDPNCNFVFTVGTKKLIKRKQFDEFIINYNGG